MKRYSAGGSFHPRIPFHMVWIATDLCNARCAHCSSNSSTISPDELSTEEACNLMDQFADVGVVDLAISGGEPLMRPDIFEIIHYAVSQNISVGVGSNGANLSWQKAQRLFETGITRFQVSLDGFASVHDVLRRWPGLFDKVIRTIHIANEAGLKTHVCCTINRLNWHALERFTEFVSKLGIKRLNLSRYVSTGRGTDELDLSPEVWRSIIHLCQRLSNRFEGKLDIVSHLAQHILVDEKISNMPSFIGCQAGLGQGAVTANGTVLPCVLLPISLGNVRNQRISDIWKTSSVLKEIRNRDNLQGNCAKCEVKNQCGGCRAVSYAKTGNYLASDPRCWLDNAKVVINC